MTRRLTLLIALLLLLQSAIARAAPPVALTAYATQRPDARAATLVIGVFGGSGTLAIALPPGWAGAPATVAVSGTQLLTFALVAAADAPPGLGTIVVRMGGVERRAWVRAPGERYAPAQRPGRLWLAIVKG